MNRLVLAAAMLLVAAAPVNKAGPSRADKRLKADVLRGMQRYVLAAYRCSRLSDVQAASLPRSFRRTSVVYQRKGHWEAWSARACGQRRTFAVAMWPSRRGGIDFTIEPQGKNEPRR